ncbi:MAG: hypothetical protein GQ565_04095 [Candidatus Aegiribacteria sp.]|nr:hypothetical protein [Candidatus Aegiribacteria sp.]
MSNHIQDAGEAIRIYRDKDVVEKGLYKTMTMKDLIKTMEKLRTQVIDGRRILFPLTKRQKEIFKAFDVQPPE